MDNPSPPSSFMRRAVGSLAQLTYVTFEVIGAVIDNVGGLRRTDLYDQVSRLRTTVMDLAMENARLKEDLIEAKKELDKAVETLVSWDSLVAWNALLKEAGEKPAETTEDKCHLLGLGWCPCHDCRLP